MPSPELALLDRFKTLLSLEQEQSVAESRLGEFAGLYLWESAAAFNDFRDSELRASIAVAYQFEGEPRIVVLSVVWALRDELSIGD